MEESYAPRILLQKARKARKDTGKHELHTAWEKQGNNSVGQMLARSLSRPFLILGTKVIVQILALYMAYIYGLLYLIISTFPVLWQEQYGERVDIGGLNYISLTIGFFIGTQLCANLNSKVSPVTRKFIRDHLLIWTR